MQLEGRLLQKGTRLLIGSVLGGRIENPCVSQYRQHFIQVILKRVFFLNRTADLIKAEVIVNALQEQISAVEGMSIPFFHKFHRGAADHDRLLLFILFPVEFIYVLLCPLIGIDPICPGTNLIEIAELFNGYRTDGTV